MADQRATAAERAAAVAEASAATLMAVLETIRPREPDANCVVGRADQSPVH